MRNAKKSVVIISIIACSLLLALIIDLALVGFEKGSHPIKFSESVKKYSSEYNVPEYIVYAIINVESGFDENATSGEGAMGLMQILPTTFELLTSSDHLDEGLSLAFAYDPDTNIRYGCYYLSYLFSKFYDWNTTVAAYHAGENTVYNWIAGPLSIGQTQRLTSIPSKDTAKYVKKINKEIKYYKRLYYQK